LAHLSCNNFPEKRAREPHEIPIRNHSSKRMHSRECTSLQIHAPWGFPTASTFELSGAR